ncbi:hypothetical protein GCM10018793_36270 [Streptomyces sulfonofaciens]|uniref:Uncharacterized protein n=1 Tax=Streptomyces sulfonofaciens TaxID=68272 RepID=A0A919L0S5_9ACTN|nr:hypothetical protein GCM10018793_36270 [Streptomyces sulfonofaciens]
MHTDDLDFAGRRCPVKAKGRAAGPAVTAVPCRGTTPPPDVYRPPPPRAPTPGHSRSVKIKACAAALP